MQYIKWLPTFCKTAFLKMEGFMLARFQSSQLVKSGETEGISIGSFSASNLLCMNMLAHFAFGLLFITR